LAKRNCSPTFNERRPNPHKNCESTSEASQRCRLSELKAFHFIEMMNNKENQKNLTCDNSPHWADVRTPSIADLFVAVMGNQAPQGVTI